MPFYDDEILEKGVNEVITFGINFSTWLDTGETISSVDTLSSDKSDLTIGSGSISGSSVLFQASAGTCGNYVITCKITTSDSNEYEVGVKLRIR